MAEAKTDQQKKDSWAKGINPNVDGSGGFLSNNSGTLIGGAFAALLFLGGGEGTGIMPWLLAFAALIGGFLSDSNKEGSIANWMFGSKKDEPSQGQGQQLQRGGAAQPSQTVSPSLNQEKLVNLSDPKHITTKDGKTTFLISPNGKRLSPDLLNNGDVPKGTLLVEGNTSPKGDRFIISGAALAEEGGFKKINGEILKTEGKIAKEEKSFKIVNGSIVFDDDKKFKGQSAENTALIGEFRYNLPIDIKRVEAALAAANPPELQQKDATPSEANKTVKADEKVEYNFSDPLGGMYNTDGTPKNGSEKLKTNAPSAANIVITPPPPVEPASSADKSIIEPSSEYTKSLSPQQGGYIDNIVRINQDRRDRNGITEFMIDEDGKRVFPSGEEKYVPDGTLRIRASLNGNGGLQVRSLTLSEGGGFSQSKEFKFNDGTTIPHDGVNVSLIETRVQNEIRKLRNIAESSVAQEEVTSRNIQDDKRNNTIVLTDSKDLLKLFFIDSNEKLVALGNNPPPNGMQIMVSTQLDNIGEVVSIKPYDSNGKSLLDVDLTGKKVVFPVDGGNIQLLENGSRQVISDLKAFAEQSKQACSLAKKESIYENYNDFNGNNQKYYPITVTSNGTEMGKGNCR